jgi:hypothetical protein
VSEYVVLCLPLPGGVVTWFVTGSTACGSRPGCAPTMSSVVRARGFDSIARSRSSCRPGCGEKSERALKIIVTIQNLAEFLDQCVSGGSTMASRRVAEKLSPG